MRATLESRLETLALFIREQVAAASERGERALTDAELVEIERARCLLKAVRVCHETKTRLGTSNGWGTAVGEARWSRR